MIDVAIVGASGYGGGELMRLLSGHPEVNLKALVSDTYAGQPPSAAFAGLRSSKLAVLRFQSSQDNDAPSKCDVVFLAQDNGKAMHSVPALLAAGCKVIDLSADFRFRDSAIYPVWYGFKHAQPALCETAVYGLPELNEEKIRSANLVGNPGCYPTASILALAPLVSAGLIDLDSIIVDAKSGVSGAGRSKFGLDYHYPEANESVSAYKVGGTHRHVPEIEQALDVLSGAETRISFTPHLVPMSRGILATCYARLADSTTSAASIRERYNFFYTHAPFVSILEKGTPSTKHTLGSNQCHIGFEIDKRTGRIVVVSAIDNLVKGMAGQAIQNMNLISGFDQTLGLDLCGIWP